LLFNIIRTSKSFLWRNLWLINIIIDIRRSIYWALSINNRRKNWLGLNIYIFLGLENLWASRNSWLSLSEFLLRLTLFNIWLLTCTAFIDRNTYIDRLYFLHLNLILLVWGNYNCACSFLFDLYPLLLLNLRSLFLSYDCRFILTRRLLFDQYVFLFCQTASPWT
jgi:hypothetical protein